MKKLAILLTKEGIPKVANKQDSKITF
jgi:hypothetical protein